MFGSKDCKIGDDGRGVDDDQAELANREGRIEGGVRWAVGLIGRSRGNFVRS